MKKSGTIFPLLYLIACGPATTQAQYNYDFDVGVLCPLFTQWPWNASCWETIYTADEFGSYSNIDFPSEARRNAPWMLIPDIKVVDRTTAPGLIPATEPGHLMAKFSYGVIKWVPDIYWHPQSDVGPAYGQLGSFYYGCTDMAGVAVDCTITFNASFVVTNRTRAYPLWTPDYLVATTTLSYTTASATPAPMVLGDLTHLSSQLPKPQKGLTAQPFAKQYTYSAKTLDGHRALLHLDNIHSSWWYTHHGG